MHKIVNNWKRDISTLIHSIYKLKTCILDYGSGYAWNPPALDVHVGDSVQWTWTAPELVRGMAYRVTQTESPSSDEDHPDGFSSGTHNTESGKNGQLLQSSYNDISAVIPYNYVGGLECHLASVLFLPLGTYTYQFTTPGVYYYYSGDVDQFGAIVMRGAVNVLDNPSHMEDIVVTVGGHEAIYHANGEISKCNHWLKKQHI